MKYLLLALVFTTSVSYASDVVPTKNLTPVVKIADESFEIKDRYGNKWHVNTNCQIEVDSMTEFTIRSKYVKKGTEVKLSDQQRCVVDYVAKL